MRPWESPHERTKLIKSSSTIEAGRKLALETERWMVTHEESFVAIRGFCQGLRDKHVTSRAREHVMAFCAANGIDVGANPRGFDNDVFAGVARYLVLEDASLAGAPIAFKDSCIDCYGLIPIEYVRYGDK